MALNAIEGIDACEILQYLHDQGVRFSEAELQKLLAQAGLNSDTYDPLYRCAKWLRHTCDAPWPEYLGVIDVDEDGDALNHWCWADTAVMWARSEGCESPLLSEVYHGRDHLYDYRCV